MSILLYVETRANEIVETEVIGSFSTDEERNLVLAKEIDTCRNNFAQAAIEALETWDMKAPLSYQYDSRTRRAGNWMILPA